MAVAQDLTNPNPPRCKGCGDAHPHVVARYDEEGRVRSHVWLCGSCEYREQHPDALPFKDPRRRAARWRTERLFDVP